MAAGRQSEYGSGFLNRGLLQQRVSRRALLTLSLVRGAAIAAGPGPRPAIASKAAPEPEPLRPAPCGACGAYHGPDAVCPVETRQRALVRGFGRASWVVSPAPPAAMGEREGGS